MAGNRLTKGLASGSATLLVTIVVSACENPVDPQHRLYARNDAAQASTGGSPPAAPGNVRFEVMWPTMAETRITVRWIKPDNADSVTVYRYREPIFTQGANAAQATPRIVCPPFCPPGTSLWEELGTVAAPLEYFHDDDLSTPNGRSLGAIYRYKVKASNESGASQFSPEISARTRGINSAHQATVPESDRTPTSVTFKWRDNSAINVGYKIRDRKTGSIYDLDDPDATSHRFTGLTPGKGYCYEVWAYDYQGSSSKANACGVTPPEDEDPPDSEHTVTVFMERQQIGKGPIPYLGRRGPIRPAPHLIRILNPKSNATLLFVKAGRSTQECSNPSAVVPLGPGQQSTPAMLEDIYGTSMPPLGPLEPLYFLACVSAGGPALQRIPISITYRDP